MASSYDFSGGQIENIARKRTVDVIIGGVEPTLETLHSYCRSELLYKATERQRIGFRNITVIEIFNTLDNMTKGRTSSKESTANLFNRYVWLVDTVYQAGKTC